MSIDSNDLPTLEVTMKYIAYLTPSHKCGQAINIMITLEHICRWVCFFPAIQQNNKHYYQLCMSNVFYLLPKGHKDEPESKKYQPPFLSAPHASFASDYINIVTHSFLYAIVYEVFDEELKLMNGRKYYLQQHLQWAINSCIQKGKRVIQ